MQFLPIFIFALSFFVFLLSLYGLANDDFVLLRRHVSTEKVFNMAFLTGVAALLGARLLYVLFHFSPLFLNPLAFLLFPYFPGLSLSGGVIGGSLFLIVYARKNLLPLGRFFDFFGMAFLSALWSGLLAELAFGNKSGLFVILAATIIIYGVLFFVCYRFLQKEHLKEGSIGLLVLVSFSVISFVTGFVGKREWVIFFLSKEDFVLVGIFLISLIILIRQEKLLSKLRTL